MRGAEQRHEGDTLSLRDDLHHWLGTRTPLVIALLAVLGVGVIGILDYLTGYEFSFSVSI